MTKLIHKDIEIILKNTQMFSKYFSGKRILITGGNGFIGKYFIEIFKEYNKFLKKPILVSWLFPKPHMIAFCLLLQLINYILFFHSMF